MNMIRYKIGYNFDKGLIDFIAKMNDLSPYAKIESVYASAKNYDYLTARPRYRLPDVTDDELSEHIDLLHKIGVEFHYAINSSYIGNKHQVNENTNEIVSFLLKLQSIGVDGVIVTHPLIADFVYNNTNLPISISSIANIFSVNQMYLLNEKYGCDSFCLSPYHNRNIGTLKRMQSHCSLFKSNIELIVNEFCGLGSKSGAFSPCIYREACFDCHSENKTIAEESLLDGFPQSMCISNRTKQDSAFWAKTMVIRPEDIHKYHALGVNKFKITGRTANSTDLKRVVNAYMTFNFDGDLAQLWYMGVGEKTIENRRLQGFVDYWFEHPEVRCDENLCGVTCKHCYNFFMNEHD